MLVPAGSFSELTMTFDPGVLLCHLLPFCYKLRPYVHWLGLDSGFPKSAVFSHDVGSDESTRHELCRLPCLAASKKGIQYEIPLVGVECNKPHRNLLWKWTRVVDEFWRHWCDVPD